MTVAEISRADLFALEDDAQRDPARFCRDVLGCAPYAKQIELIEAVRDYEQVTVVGANCIAPETRLENADTGALVRVDEIGAGFPVWSVHDGRVVRAVADRPYVKGWAPLYRVTMQTGEQFVCTLDHRLLTRQGWRTLRQLGSGAFVARARRRTVASSLSSLADGGCLSSTDGCSDHFLQGVLDSRRRCRSLRRCDGGRSRTVEGIDRVAAPPRADAHGHSLDDWHAGGRGDERERSHLDQGVSVPAWAWGQSARDSIRADEGSSRHGRPATLAAPRATFGLSVGVPRGTAATVDPVDVPSRASRHLHAGEMPCSYTNPDTTEFVPITSIEYERAGVYYDLHVPGPENYLAEGVFHHNSTGKDWMAGRIVAWWLCAHDPAKVVITGPTNRQVAEIVWREVRLAYHGARVREGLGGRMMPVESRWEYDDEKFAIGFSTDRPYSYLGFHSPNLLVIVTEAHDFKDTDFQAIKRLMPKRLLLTGNPFSDSGEFYESHHQKRHIYHAITIKASDTPNWGDGPEVPGIVTRRDAARLAVEYGEESDYYKATVNCEFVGRPDGLLTLAWLQRARMREVEDDGESEVVAGLDVAGPGEDETSLLVRADASILASRVWSQPDPRGDVVAALAPYKARLSVVNVDTVGIGHYMARHLEDQKFPVRDVNVGEAPSDSEKYRNLKAELYWGLRLRFEAGDMAGLTDEATIAQLASIRYRHNSRGQVEIESKDDARKRGIKSPDRAEAVMLAFAPPRPRVGYVAY